VLSAHKDFVANCRHRLFKAEILTGRREIKRRSPTAPGYPDLVLPVFDKARVNRKLAWRSQCVLSLQLARRNLMSVDQESIFDIGHNVMAAVKEVAQHLRCG